MRSTRFYVLALALAPLVAAPSPDALAQDLEVNVRGSGGRAYQVAIQRFAPDAKSGPLVRPFYEDLVGALEPASSFEVVDPAAFLEPEQTGDFNEPLVACDNWRATGADILVQGRIDARLAGHRVQYRIWDIGRCRMQGQAAYLDAEVQDLWLAARKLADELVQRFTGKRGVSSTQIAFVSDVSGNKEIYLMESDGSRRRRVTSNGVVNLFPSWSPDGATILYTSYRAGASDVSARLFCAPARTLCYPARLSCDPTASSMRVPRWSAVGNVRPPAPVSRSVRS